MSSENTSLHHASRFVAVLGVILIILSILGGGILVAKVLENAGYEWVGEIPIANDDMQLLLYGIGGAFAVGAIMNVLGNFFAGLFGPTQPQSTSSTSESGDSISQQAPAPERYRRSLAKQYAFVGGFILVLVGISLSAGVLTADGTTSIVDLFVTYASFGIRILFGSVLGALLTAGIFVALAIGLRRRSAEALLVGLVVGVCFLPVALATRSLGFGIFALSIIYYSIRARNATEFVFVEAAGVPDAVRHWVE